MVKKDVKDVKAKVVDGKKSTKEKASKVAAPPETIIDAKETEQQPQKESKEAEKGKVNKEGRGYVTVVTSVPDKKLNVRSLPCVPADGEEDNIVTELAFGTRRQVMDFFSTEKDGSWIKVKEGWVMIEFVK